MSRWCLIPLVPALVFVLAGCGGTPTFGKVKVKGHLVRNSRPLDAKALKAREDDSVEIALLPKTQSPDHFPATAEYNPADGTFVFHGPTGHGVMPGEYRVLVTWTPYGGGPDRLHEQFSDDNSTLVYTVTDEPEQDITIDLGKKTVMKTS